MTDAPLSQKAIDRFWAKVQKTPGDGCWTWIGGKTPAGYGCFWRGHSSRGAHRISYELLVGPIAKGLHLDHLCRNHGCVNPAHLEPVTNAENCRRGVRARLTWADVEVIRASDATTFQLGERFGVHPAHISKIRTGKMWVAK